MSLLKAIRVCKKQKLFYKNHHIATKWESMHYRPITSEENGFGDGK